MSKIHESDEEGRNHLDESDEVRKELAVKHQKEIRRRSKSYEGTKPITSPRAIGMALQSEFADFFERMNGVKLTPKNEKDRPGPDRLEVEEWRARQIKQDAEDEARKILDKAQAEKDLASANLVTVKTVLKRFKDIYDDVRQSLPRIRQILTWDMATEAEKRQARQDRKQVVTISPVLRNAIRDTEERMRDMSPPVEKAFPEADGPGF